MSNDESRLEPRMVEGTPRTDQVCEQWLDGGRPGGVAVAPFEALCRQLEREVEYWRARCVRAEKPRD